MTMVAINWRPTHRQLRQFALICFVALPLVAWLWGAGTTLILWFAAIGMAIAITSIFFPSVIAPLFVALTLVTLPIGLVISELILLAVFFGIFMPIGLFFRIRRREALQLKFDRAAKSYWKPKRQPSGPASYYRQS